MSRAPTETGYMVTMVEDLLTTAAGVPVVGDDGLEHGLTYGDARPATVAWSCTCAGWTGDADDLHPIDLARGFLHHVWPSRHSAKWSTIMVEVLRSVRESPRGRRTPSGPAPT